MVIEYVNLIVGIGIICAPFIIGVRISDDIVARHLKDESYTDSSS